MFVSDRAFRVSCRQEAAAVSQEHPGVSLVRKLVSVLESIEKLQVYNYDSTGTVSGLQVRPGAAALCPANRRWDLA